MSINVQTSDKLFILLDSSVDAANLLNLSLYSAPENEETVNEKQSTLFEILDLIIGVLTEERSLVCQIHTIVV